MKKILIYILIAFIISSCNFQQKDDQDDKTLSRSLDEYFTKNMKNGFSGVILISKEGETILSKGYGFSDIEKKIPNTSKTIFDIGSNTKQFTATAVLKLVEQNKLQMTDSLKSYFNTIPKDKANITIHQLLTHSSGFETYSGNDFDPITLEDFLNRVFDTQLKFEPGKGYNYSNIGYSILAIVIEKVSEREYEQYLQEHLFQPAGMLQTGYLLPNWKDLDIAVGYHRGYRKIGKMPAKYKELGVTWHLKGNGGINSSVDDMHKWYRALMSDKVIPKALREKLFDSHVLESKEFNSYYGYGWSMSTSKRKTRIAAHSGANPLFYSDIFIAVDEDVLVVYCTNQRTPELEYLVWKFQERIFNPDFYTSGDSKKLVQRSLSLYIKQQPRECVRTSSVH